MLELKNVVKIYTNNGQQVEAIKNLNLCIKEHEFIALVGPSGCGKTTLLKIIAGLVPCSSGGVFIDGEKIKAPGKDRGLIFQEFTLFPWLTMRGNISFGLDLQKINFQKKTSIVDHYLRITGLQDFAEFYPHNLSGGMQQRVAIARTLANNPKILLMDEPFGALDAQTRSKMQEFLAQLWEADRKTVVFVTHDIEEAIFLADKIFLLSPRPCFIKQEFTINFPRPRTHELKYSEEFSKLKKQIAKYL
jgi:ABC-type nitrate/sulfonate/bicarbonate transport system ATPase subunit